MRSEPASHSSPLNGSSRLPIDGRMSATTAAFLRVPNQSAMPIVRPLSAISIQPATFASQSVVEPFTGAIDPVELAPGDPCSPGNRDQSIDLALPYGLTVRESSLGGGSGLDASADPYRPDPASVQRFGAGYRYPQAGWIVLHIEGEPYERGYQHGRLMAPEIARFVGELAGIAAARPPPTPGKTCGCWPMPSSCADLTPNTSRR